MNEWRREKMDEDEIDPILEDDETLWYELDGEQVFNWSLAFFKSPFEIIQVGLTMEQIRKYNPPHNPAKITDPRAKDYIKQYGQVSWEVDALSPQVMRDIVNTAIVKKMDIDVYNSVLKEEKEDRVKLGKIIKDLKNE